MELLVKNPERVGAIVEHIVGHYQTKVEASGFKAQVVVIDQECSMLYEKVMDELIGLEASAVVTSSKALPVQMQKCLAFFPNVDRSLGGYNALMAAKY